MFEPGWYKQLEDQLHSEGFRDIARYLMKIHKAGVETAPSFNDTFQAFKECSWSNLNTVILGMDPYPGKLKTNEYVADGLAFSSRYSTTCPKSLSYIFNAVDEDINNKSGYYPKNYDLARWSEQGILLLNCALSFPLKEKAGAHIELWRPFIEVVLKAINERKDSVAFILMGNYAKAYRRLLTNETFAIYTCEHPSAANYHGGKWRHENVFSAVDGFHKFKNNIKIKW